MAEERNIRIEDDKGNVYYPHSKAKTTFLSNGKDVEKQLGDLSTLKTTNKNNMVGALNELFTNANNGKKLISDVVGSPLLVTDSFQQQKDKIQGLKNTFASNLNGKGQSSSSTESLNGLVDKVKNIKTEPKTGDKINLLEFNNDIQLKSIWSYKFNEDIDNLKMLSSNIDNSIYIAIYKQSTILYKFDNDGNILWKKSLPDYTRFLKVDNNDNLYIRIDDSNIGILNKDGVEIRNLILTPNSHKFGVSNDGKYIFCTTSDKDDCCKYNLLKIDTISGKIIEEKIIGTETSYKYYSAIKVGNERLYAIMDNMICCHTFDGSLIWKDIVDYHYKFDYEGEINKTNDSLAVFSPSSGIHVYNKYGECQIYDKTPSFGEHVPAYHWSNGDSILCAPYHSNDLILFYNSRERTYLHSSIYFYSNLNFIIAKNNDILYVNNNEIYRKQYLLTVI